MIKTLPATQETWDLSLGWEGPLEEGMATHSSILAWRIPWTEEPAAFPRLLRHSPLCVDRLFTHLYYHPENIVLTFR